MLRIDAPKDRHEQLNVLRVLFANEPQPAERADEALQLADANEIDLSGLVGGWWDGSAVAAGLVCRFPDGTAFAWPPSVIESAPQPQAIAIALLHRMLAMAGDFRSDLVQTSVDPQRLDQCAALRSAGFQHLGRLQYLQRPLDQPLRGDRHTPGTPVAFNDANEDRFANVIQRTYIGTEDCPEFSGVRTAAEALRSYRFSGQFTPERWRLIECEGDDVATIIVNDRPNECSREIVYVGVVPEMRGRGFAQQLVAEAISEAMTDGRDTMLTAVDVANGKAVRLYSRLGFLPTVEREVFIWHRNLNKNAGCLHEGGNAFGGPA